MPELELRPELVFFGVLPPAPDARDHGRARRHPGATLLGYAAIVSLTVIVVRFAWVFAVLHAPKWIARRMSSWRGAIFLSWTGMRGAFSLAAALALPLETDVGAAFPGRDLIVFLTFAVILVTLGGQALTLPLVIRALGLEDDGADERGTRKPASMPPRPRSLAWRSSKPKNGSARTRRSMCAACTSSARTASAPASTTATTEASRPARRTSSACVEPCSTPSETRSSSCGARASSRTTSGFASRATWTSRTSGWKPEATRGPQ